MTEFEKRISVAYKATRKNKNYKKRIHKIIDLGRKIMDRLGPERSLFLEYEITLGLSEKIYAENIYCIGFKDGQKRSLLRKPCPTKCPTEY